MGRFRFTDPPYDRFRLATQGRARDRGAIIAYRVDRPWRDIRIVADDFKPAEFAG